MRKIVQTIEPAHVGSQPRRYSHEIFLKNICFSTCDEHVAGDDILTVTLCIWTYSYDDREGEVRGSHCTLGTHCS